MLEVKRVGKVYRIIEIVKGMDYLDEAFDFGRRVLWVLLYEVGLIIDWCKLMMLIVDCLYFLVVDFNF